jgi:translocation and assembly module TamA
MKSRSLLIVLIGWVMVSPVSADLVLTGLTTEMADLVSPQTSLWQQPCGLNRWVVRYQYGQLTGELSAALETFGYYSPAINSDLTFPSLLPAPELPAAATGSAQQPTGKDCWHASAHIDLGAPVLVRQISLSVIPETPVFRQVSQALIALGQRFDHQHYEGYKAELERIAAEQGFFDAQFLTREVVVDPEALTAEINLEWSVGERYRFGAVTYIGADFDASLLDRYLPFAPGDPYNALSLGTLYQELLSSDYFADVVVDADIEHQGEQNRERVVPVNVTLTPIDPTETQLGLGFSTDIGAKASVSHINKRVNNRGHRFESTLSLGERESEIGGFYRLPDPEYASGWTSFYAGVNKTDTDTSDSITSKLGVRQLVLLRGNWIMTRYIEVVADDFTVGGVDQQTANLVPGVSLSHTFANLTRRPRFGYRIETGASGASRAVGSDTDFVNLFVSGKVILPLLASSRLIFRGQVAAVLSDDFDALAPENRYFTGGDSKVRGYDFESLGPTDENGVVVGGNRLLEASFELDQRITEDWALAVFFDAGNATLGSFSSTFSTSVGLGARWYSPIGPVQVDVAAPTDGGGFRLHINLGPEL